MQKQASGERGDALEGQYESFQASGQVSASQTKSFAELQRELSWGTSPELFDMEMSGKTHSLDHS